MGAGEVGCCTKQLCTGRVGGLNKQPPFPDRIKTV